MAAAEPRALLQTSPDERLVAAVRGLEAAIAAAPQEPLPWVHGELARLSAAVTLRLVRTSAGPAAVEPEDRMLDVTVAAARLKVKKAWLYENHRRLPFAKKIGGHVRFSNNGITAWIRKGR